MDKMISRRIKRFEDAIKLNREIILMSNSPHERDTCRGRINLLKRKLNELYALQCLILYNRT